MDIKKFYEHYWEKEAGRGFALAERQKQLRIALSAVPAGASILDAGCGRGEFSVFLTQLGYQVTGIDISEVAVEKARSEVPTGLFKCGSLEAVLPFESEQFSAIWCSEVLEHLFDVHAALSELNRVLVLNGRLVLTVPYHGFLKNIAIAIAGFERHYNPYISHIRFFTRKSLETCLTLAGFKADSWRGIGRPWPLWKAFFVTAQRISNPRAAPEIIG